MALRLTDAEYQALLKRRASNERRNASDVDVKAAKTRQIAEAAPKLHGRGALEFVVDGEPFAWRRTTGNGKQRYTEKAMRAHQNVVKSVAQLSGAVVLSGPLVLEVLCYRTVPRSWSKRRQHDARIGLLRPTSVPDASNYLKEIEDALNTVAWADDAQVVKATVEKWYARGDMVAHTRVRVTPL